MGNIVECCQMFFIVVNCCQMLSPCRPCLSSFGPSQRRRNRCREFPLHRNTRSWELWNPPSFIFVQNYFDSGTIPSIENNVYRPKDYLGNTFWSITGPKIQYNKLSHCAPNLIKRDHYLSQGSTYFFPYSAALMEGHLNNLSN